MTKGQQDIQKKSNSNSPSQLRFDEVFSSGIAMVSMLSMVVPVVEILRVESLRDKKLIRCKG